jgi:hypothetical protein
VTGTFVKFITARYFFAPKYSLGAQDDFSNNPL